MKNKKILIKGPIFVFYKIHKCPNCKKTIIPKKIKKVINSDSINANNYDFSFGDSYLIGDVEFTFYIFFCGFCNKEYQIKEIQKYEKKVKEIEIINNCHNKYIKNIKLFMNKYFNI